jgi:hypothetical protein
VLILGIGCGMLMGLATRRPPLVLPHGRAAAHRRLD